jgi:hypothetical protein
MNIEKYISPFIESQFPQFYQEEGEQFIAFVKAYYEWMESEGNIINQTRSLLDYRDIDTTLRDYISHFKQKYINSLPENVVADKKLLIKHILELYRSKGTEASYKFLFKMLFNEEIEVYLPGDHIFKLSDGEWILKKYIEISDSPYLSDMIGKEIYSTTTNSRAVVDNYFIARVNNKLVNVMFLNDLRGNFKYGERIFCVELPQINQDNAPIIFGSLSTVSITNGGLGYKVGDILDIQNSGVGGKARVSSTTSKNGEVTFDIIKGGTGFSLDAVVNVDGLQLPIKKIYSKNPAVVATSAPHKLKNGNSLRIDFTTNGFEPINTSLYSYFVNVINTTAFSTYTDITLTTPYDGTALGSLLNIQYVTKANPIVLSTRGIVVKEDPENPGESITVTETIQHGLENGDQVAIQNVEGMTELNDKIFFVKSNNLTEFSLYRDKGLTIPVNSTGFTTHESNTGYIFTNTPIYDIVPIKNIEKTNPVKVETSTFHYLKDGDFIKIDIVNGTTELNVLNFSYYVKLSNTTAFSLYSDESLTTPINGTGFTTYVSGGFIYKFPFYFGNTGYTYLNTGGEGATFKIGSLVNKEVLKINTDHIHDYVPTVLDDTENGYALTIDDVIGNTTIGTYSHGNIDEFAPGNIIKMGEVDVREFDVEITSETLMSNGEILSNTTLGIGILEISDVNSSFLPDDLVYQTNNDLENGTNTAIGAVYYSPDKLLIKNVSGTLNDAKKLYNANEDRKITKLNVVNITGQFEISNRIFQTDNGLVNGTITASGVVYYSSGADIRVDQLSGTFVQGKIFNTASDSNGYVSKKLTFYVVTINGTFNVSDVVYQTNDNTKTGNKTATGLVYYSSGSTIRIHQTSGTFSTKKMFNDNSNSNGVIDSITTVSEAAIKLNSYAAVDTIEIPTLTHLKVVNTDDTLLALTSDGYAVDGNLVGNVHSELLYTGTILKSNISGTTLKINTPYSAKTVSVNANLVDVLSNLLYANNQNGYFLIDRTVSVVGRISDVTISHANPAVVTTTVVADANFTIFENDPIKFNTNGGLPAGIQDYQYYPEKVYYAVNVDDGIYGFPDLRTFNIAETPSGTPIATTSDGFGTHNITNIVETGISATVTHNKRMTDWFQFGIPLPFPFNRKNLDTRISVLIYVDKEVGTIASLTQINPGTGYSLDPTVSVIEPLVKELGYYELFGPYVKTLKGFNASITAKAINANGIVTSIEVIDSGFGYDRDQTVELLSNSNPYAVTGKTVVDLNGTAAGYWLDNKSFVSDEMYLQDSNYYQNYAYEIVAERMMHTYENYVKDLVHPTGMRMFGRFIVRSEIDISTVNDIVESAIVQKPREEYYRIDSGNILVDNTTILSDNEII